MPPCPDAPPIQVDLLPYAARLDGRPAAQIDLVVIHCTELPDLAMARQFGEQLHYPASQTGNSGHYYIDRDVSYRDVALHQYVPLERVAHHTHGYNSRSVGIELVNRGRYPDWLDSRRQAMDEAYPDAQIAALIALLRWLQIALPTLRFIAGHEDLDTGQVAASDDPSRRVHRKRDPGPRFPWPQVLDAVRLERIFG